MDNITKQLQGCSKAELIEVIMEMKRHSIGIGVTWETVIANARLRTIEDKLDEILQHQEKLHEKMNAIQQVDSVLRDLRDKELNERFDGSNYKELSREYGISEMTIREIVKEKRRQLRGKALEGQLSFDD